MLCGYDLNGSKYHHGPGFQDDFAPNEDPYSSDTWNGWNSGYRNRSLEKKGFLEADRSIAKEWAEKFESGRK